MLRRGLAVVLPLSFLVAALAHGALFGAEHLPGAAHASALFNMLGAGLALAALGALLAAALRPRGANEACEAWDRFFPAILGVGGLGAYALIELAEGHGPFAGGWPVIVSIGLAAALVFGLARVAARLLALGGCALAALATSLRSALPPAPVVLKPIAILESRRRDRSPSRGRAPPFLV